MINVARHDVLRAGGCNGCPTKYRGGAAMNVLRFSPNEHQTTEWRLCDNCMEELIHQYEKLSAPRRK